jgi:hypothetical protein
MVSLTRDTRILALNSERGDGYCHSIGFLVLRRSAFRAPDA